ncbi:hypothetical protein [Nocardioides sp. HB32]
MTTWTIALTAAGAVGTFALGMFADAWRTRLGIKAAKNERDDLRAIARQDRRDEFEVAALLELQDVIVMMARQVGIGHNSDEMHYRATGSWKAGAPLLPDEAGGEKSLEVGRSFLRLKPRVPSADLRRVLDDFHRSCKSAQLTPDGDGTNDASMRSEAIRRFESMADHLEVAQDAIGARIRELYAY